MPQRQEKIGQFLFHSVSQPGFEWATELRQKYVSCKTVILTSNHCSVGTYSLCSAERFTL